MTPLAYIDVGTNSTNLLVADRSVDLQRTVAVTRLGEGLHLSGTLSTRAMERTIETVAAHAGAARSLGAAAVTVVGTEACRRAANTGEFAAMIRERTGLVLEVLSPDDEARLSFAGALRDLPPVDGGTLVLDIGGGSTEISVGTDRSLRTFSIPIGAVTATESDLVTDPPRPEDLTNVIGAVQDELEDLSHGSPGVFTAARAVGVAGTVVTVAAVEIGLDRFDDSVLHGFRLTREAAEDVFRTLATESLADRRLNPGLPPDRADVIVAGCCILVAVMRRLRLDSITVSTRGLLDGLAERGRIGA